MNNLTNFNILLSQTRLSSYNNDIIKHYDNLKLVGKITPKIATLEIILRNKLDSKLSELDNEWIKNSNDGMIKNTREKIEEREKNKILSHHQYLSRMSLGTIIYLIKENRVQDSIMNLNNINFRNYNQYNRNFFLRNGKKRNFGNIYKVDIVLSLLQNLRNRSYHWENILKTTEKNGKHYPRLTTKIENAYIGINPQKIELFLDDLIKTFDEEILKYCQD
ncbi:hypothetical protein [Campylobacter upsaliensis]|uniref:hypothetical protein n=2 Tax=Campylobacter upsaliensis TaxID=28080 RepID=UPI002225EAF1|nr:hypothetical protein [Campylobacter upsaliensis]MEB2799661.1 hypothetical protein [Campylobacter upsaliensis]MEB2815351.1 hypothetical protein [Campylobacter upsaliensis]MEB2830540.1 hypothetical protein [Campylobacter upsaliensis]MEB2833976.1 hypothetical protein [Campylobacter upsaliensis]MEB2835515.1 hypothetical protein [Campylobacter upsaliensis]